LFVIATMLAFPGGLQVVVSERMAEALVGGRGALD
jgi:hypothetical protein